MERLISYERTTRLGARHGTQVQDPDGGRWVFVSEQPTATLIGRVDGYNIWEMVGPDGNNHREYHRSNSGAVVIIDRHMADGPYSFCHHQG